MSKSTKISKSDLKKMFQLSDTCGLSVKVEEELHKDEKVARKYFVITDGRILIRSGSDATRNLLNNLGFNANTLEVYTDKDGSDGYYLHQGCATYDKKKFPDYRQVLPANFPVAMTETAFCQRNVQQVTKVNLIYRREDGKYTSLSGDYWEIIFEALDLYGSKLHQYGDQNQVIGINLDGNGSTDLQSARTFVLVMPIRNEIEKQLPALTGQGGDNVGEVVDINKFKDEHKYGVDTEAELTNEEFLKQLDANWNEDHPPVKPVPEIQKHWDYNQD